MFISPTETDESPLAAAFCIAASMAATIARYFETSTRTENAPSSTSASSAKIAKRNAPESVLVSTVAVHLPSASVISTDRVVSAPPIWSCAAE